ncbi:MAG: FAD-dependent oxidoreductase, partial [Eubacteriales bacterium]
TDEMYIQGFSSSMPADIQLMMLRSLDGFEHAHVMRTAYAIEYDCADPTQLYPTLEFKNISGLYGAGQFNGTSGYEEAAAQGIVAGINAALRHFDREPMILTRDNSYIGMLIDDLTVKGTREPYRVMTSRSEYRLLLRQDNADERLCDIGRRVGLLDDIRYAAYTAKRTGVEREIARIGATYIKPSQKLEEILENAGTAPAPQGARLAELIRRPQLSYEILAPVDTTREPLARKVCECAETEIKYEGYVKRQKADAERMRRMDDRRLSPDLDYSSMSGLRLEARQKLESARPLTLGAASRISGVSPADITALIIHLGMK